MVCKARNCNGERLSLIFEMGKSLPATNTTPTYDADGNLLNDGRFNDAWDAEQYDRIGSILDEGEAGARRVKLLRIRKLNQNRLTRLQPTAGALAGGHPHLILEFAYDYQSRRIRKQVIDAANGNAILSDRRFLYDGWNLVAEFEATPSNQLDPVAYHFWGNDLSGTEQGAGGVGGLFMSRIKRPDNQAWEIYHPTYDGNGNIIAWVDGTGSVIQRLDYDAFGNTLTRQGTFPGGIKMNFGFSTKYEDSESGLLYYGYRYYDPVTGRWPSRDPIGERWNQPLRDGRE